VRDAIGFGAFCVLAYYAIANAAARTLPRQQLRWPRALTSLGLIGCVALAFTLPTTSVLTGGGVLAAGALIWLLRHRPRERKGDMP
jgi:APA family basic amino acid/polyamine antiporter